MTQKERQEKTQPSVAKQGLEKKKGTGRAQQEELLTGE